MGNTYTIYCTCFLAAILTKKNDKKLNIINSENMSIFSELMCLFLNVRSYNIESLNAFFISYSDVTRVALD